MTRSLSMIAFLVSLAFAPALASAQAVVIAPTQATRTEVRQGMQRGRIAAGVAEGSVGPREARHLARQQRRVERAQRRAERDGVLTLREQARLEHRQDRASRHIARARH
jgi:hypothetical protein